MVLCDLTDAKNCVFHGRRGRVRGQRGERGKSNELNLSNGKYIFVGAERILFFFSLLLLFFFFSNHDASNPCEPASLSLLSKRHAPLHARQIVPAYWRRFSPYTVLSKSVKLGEQSSSKTWLAGVRSPVPHGATVGWWISSRWSAPTCSKILAPPSLEGRRGEDGWSTTRHGSINSIADSGRCCLARNKECFLFYFWFHERRRNCETMEDGRWIFCACFFWDLCLIEDEYFG